MFWLQHVGTPLGPLKLHSLDGTPPLGEAALLHQVNAILTTAYCRELALKVKS